MIRREHRALLTVSVTAVAATGALSWLLLGPQTAAPDATTAPSSGSHHRALPAPVTSGPAEAALLAAGCTAGARDPGPGVLIDLTDRLPQPGFFTSREMPGPQLTQHALTHGFQVLLYHPGRAAPRQVRALTERAVRAGANLLSIPAHRLPAAVGVAQLTRQVSCPRFDERTRRALSDYMGS